MSLISANFDAYLVNKLTLWRLQNKQYLI